MEKRLSRISLVAIGLLVPALANAEPILTQINQLAQQTGQKAQEQQQELQAKLDAIKEQKVEEAQKLVQVAQQAAQDAQSALLTALANGEAAVANQLNCTLVNLQTKAKIKGTLSLDAPGIGQNQYIPLNSLFPNDTSRNHLALSYSGKTGPNGYKFSLIDLHSGDSVIRSGSWSDLGLDDISEQCDHTQVIVSVNHGNAAINTDNVKQIAQDQVTEVENDAHSVVSAAQSAVAGAVH